MGCGRGNRRGNSKRFCVCVGMLCVQGQEAAPSQALQALRARVSFSVDSVKLRCVSSFRISNRIRYCPTFPTHSRDRTRYPDRTSVSSPLPTVILPDGVTRSIAVWIVLWQTLDHLSSRDAPYSLGDLFGPDLGSGLCPSSHPNLDRTANLGRQRHDKPLRGCVRGRP